MLAIGNNFGVPAEAFRQLGGFSPMYYRLAAEDRDFCSHWRASGRSIIYAPDMVVLHAHALTLVSFIRQHFHYGRGAWMYHRVLAQRYRRPQRIEPFRFYLSLLLWPLKVNQGMRPFLLMALFLVSQAAQTAGYFRGFLAELNEGTSPGEKRVTHVT